jgi:hypothetical protein
MPGPACISISWVQTLFSRPCWRQGSFQRPRLQAIFPAKSFNFAAGLRTTGFNPISQEALSDTRNKETILRLYNSLLPALAGRIHQEITPVIGLFHDFKLERVVDTWTRDPEVYYPEPISIENGNIEYLGLQLQLEGFLQPGVVPFDLYKELLLKLEPARYGLGAGKHEIWVQKGYEQTWTEAELQALTERWCGELIEDLTQRLGRLA